MHLHLHDEVRLCWFIVIVNIVIMIPETPSALSDSRSLSLCLSLSAASHALVVSEMPMTKCSGKPK